MESHSPLAMLQGPRSSAYLWQSSWSGHCFDAVHETETACWRSQCWWWYPKADQNPLKKPKLIMADICGWIYTPMWLCWNCQEELAPFQVFTFGLIKRSNGRDVTPQQHRHRWPQKHHLFLDFSSSVFFGHTYVLLRICWIASKENESVRTVHHFFY